MRLELLKHSDYNVIVVDWAGGSLPLYTQATANTRLVGLEVANLINYLKVYMRDGAQLYLELKSNLIFKHYDRVAIFFKCHVFSLD